MENIMTDPVDVTQADRELWKFVLDAPRSQCRLIDTMHPETAELQAIAKHRLASQPATSNGVREAAKVDAALAAMELGWRGSSLTKTATEEQWVELRAAHLALHAALSSPPTTNSAYGLVEEIERQEGLARTYRQAQLTAEEKLCRSEANAEGWKKRAEHLEKQLSAPTTPEPQPATSNGVRELLREARDSIEFCSGSCDGSLVARIDAAIRSLSTSGESV